MSKIEEKYKTDLKEDPLTDEELMLLEQLCYLDEEVCTEAGVKNIIYSNYKKTSVGEILEDFNAEKLANLRALDNKVISGGVMEASEWRISLRRYRITRSLRT